MTSADFKGEIPLNTSSREEGQQTASHQPQRLPVPQYLGSLPRHCTPQAQADSYHMSTLPLASLPRSNTAVPAASWAAPAAAWLVRMYPLAELAEEVTTLSMVTGGACCTTWIACPEGCCAVTMDAGM